ncbi:hypothetical protein E4T56_gene17836, partial [Termitomyces sp. T112]
MGGHPPARNRIDDARAIRRIEPGPLGMGDQGNGFAQPVLGQSFRGERVKPGQMAQTAQARIGAKEAHAFLLRRARIADKGQTGDGTAARAQRLDRHQRVIDRAQPRAGSHHHGKTPCGKLFGIKARCGQRHQGPARALNHQRSIALGQGQASGIDLHPVQRGGPMRAGGRDQAIGLGMDQRAGDQTRDGLAVGFLLQPRLHRFPVARAKTRHQTSGQHRLADAGVGARDDQPAHRLIPRAEQSRTHANMRGAQRDRGFKIAAHPHRQAGQAIVRSQLGQQGKERRGLNIGRRYAHQPGQRQARLAHLRQPGGQTGNRAAALLLLGADIDLNEAGDAAPQLLHRAGQSGDEAGPVHRMDGVEQGNRILGLVRLQLPHQMQGDVG